MTLTVARIAVCVSGGGRSLRNLLAIENNAPWSVGCVVSSSPSCLANDVAKDVGLPLFVGDFSRSKLDDTTLKLETFLADYDIQWVVLAGFLKLFPTLSSYSDRVINIHPALLPRYGGKGMHGNFVHEAVLANRDKESGASVHFVNERYDEGAVISRRVVSVEAGDTAIVLARRVFEAECRLLPDTITGLVTKTLPLPNGAVKEWRSDDL